MTFANTSYTDIIATTIESRGGDVADNVSNHNALLAKIKSEGGVQTFSGGSVILEELAFAENGNAGWYSGYETLANTAQDVISAAAFSIKQASVGVSMSGLEELQNSGKEAIIDLLDGRMQVAEDSLANLISAALYSDGTGFGGKQITGLAAAVAIAPTTGTYGGIDRANFAFWRNKKLKGSGTDYTSTMNSTAGDASSANVLFTNMWVQTTRGSDKTNLIVAGTTHWTKYLGGLQPNQRFTDPKMAALGFDNVMFMSAPVCHDTLASGLAVDITYFLNTKMIKLRPHSKRNMVSLGGKRAPVNQDANTQYMVWAGNLTCRGAQFQGVIQD